MIPQLAFSSANGLRMDVNSSLLLCCFFVRVLEDTQLVKLGAIAMHLTRTWAHTIYSASTNTHTGPVGAADRVWPPSKKKKPFLQHSGFLRSAVVIVLAQRNTEYIPPPVIPLFDSPNKLEFNICRVRQCDNLISKKWQPAVTARDVECKQRGRRSGVDHTHTCTHTRF